MAAVLIHSTYSPGPGRGILLNPSPAASPASRSASLPAFAPSNSSLSSSASSSAPGDDYFSSKSSSASPSPGPSVGSPAARHSTHLHPHSKPRTGSNPSTVRRIRFAPLPEPRRDLEPADVPLPPAFFDDDAESTYAQDGQPPLSVSSALAAATLSLAATGDSDLCRRTRSLPNSVSNSPCAARKPLPGDSLLLDPAAQPSSDANDVHPHPTTASSDLGQEWDVLHPSSSPALQSLSLPLTTPDSPRKSSKWTKMLKPLLGMSSSSSNTKSSLTRTMSAEEFAAMNGFDAQQRGRGLRLSLAGSRSSSRSRDASVSRERDQGRDRKDAADFGLPLHRWTSEGQPVVPAVKKKRASFFGGGSSSGGGSGVPLGRTQSLTSLSSNSDRKAAKPVMVTNGGRKQQRMLNGRVYGAKRNHNAFANIRSEEPEFVEWGYGGMGSVKASAGQSQIWSRVQKGNVAIGNGGEQQQSSARTGAPSAEEDDGSGMAWLKRRREQREREKKEREERERAEAEAQYKNATTEHGAEQECEQKEEEEQQQQQQHEQEGEVEQKEETEAKEAETGAPATTTPTPVSSTPLPPDTQRSASHEEHITQTVSIPARAPHHRHHHSHSHAHHHHHHGHGRGHGLSLSLSLPHPERKGSADTARGVSFGVLGSASSTPTGRVPEPEAAEEEREDTPMSGGARPWTESVTEGEGVEGVSSSATSTTSTTSEDVDDSEDSPKDSEGGFGVEEEEEEEEEEDDEEEEELLQERSRLTALGAGVEKIARHKEQHDHDHEMQQQPTTTEVGAEASS